MATYAVALYLIRLDVKARPGVSKAIWVPTFWCGIQLSRFLSLWLGMGGSYDSLEGSPVDRLFFLGCILASLVILYYRRVNVAELIVQNWALVLFYGYFLISIAWADSPFSSFKRWFKDIGNVFVALVILTEKSPTDAIRAVYIRCAYLFFPLSVVYIRYFPGVGRRYNRAGFMEAIGVTSQKNSLGALVLICGLALTWEWIERWRTKARPYPSHVKWLRFIILVFGAYILYISDSKTSMLCLAIGIIALCASRLPVLKHRIRYFGIYLLLAGLSYYTIESVFGIKEAIVEGLGRDMTFTGRTDVWRELLGLKTDPFIGVGFCSFWSDDHYQSQLPEWVASSAHNGYLEVYIDGGWLGIGFLALLLIAAFIDINSRLKWEKNFALFRLSCYLVALVGNFSESHFIRMTCVWFLLILVILRVPTIRRPNLKPLRTAEPAS